MFFFYVGFFDTENKRITRRGSEWEILAGLKDGQRFDQTPEVYSGYLLKKRKWPLKGWHKVSVIVRFICFYFYRNTLR